MRVLLYGMVCRMAHDLPPAVQYPVSVPYGVFAVFAGMPLVSLALLIFWLQASAVAALDILWAVAVWVLSVLCSWGAYRKLGQGQLWWDGNAWWWKSRSQVTWQPVEYIEVLWDAQSLLCLRWRLASGTVCCGWMSASSEAWRWGDCRRAVYSLAANASPGY